MKKTIILLVAFMLLSIDVYATEKINNGVILKIGNINAIVSGEQKVLDATPEIVDDRALIPLRFCSESLGAKVIYIDETGTAVIKKGDKTVEMILGSKAYKINGELFETDCVPVIKNDRIMVPIRVMAQALDIEVKWYESSQIITLDLDAEDIALAEYLKTLF